MQNSELFFNYLSWSNPWLVAIALNTFLLAIATLSPKKLLTPAGQLHGWALGVLIWGCLGWQGYAVVMFYFLAGSGVTRIGKAQKEAEGIAPCCCWVTRRVFAPNFRIPVLAKSAKLTGSGRF